MNPELIVEIIGGAIGLFGVAKLVASNLKYVGPGQVATKETLIGRNRGRRMPILDSREMEERTVFISGSRRIRAIRSINQSGGEEFVPITPEQEEKIRVDPNYRKQMIERYGAIGKGGKRKIAVRSIDVPVSGFSKERVPAPKRGLILNTPFIRRTRVESLGLQVRNPSELGLRVLVNSPHGNIAVTPDLDVTTNFIPAGLEEIYQRYPAFPNTNSIPNPPLVRAQTDVERACLYTANKALAGRDLIKDLSTPEGIEKVTQEATLMLGQALFGLGINQAVEITAVRLRGVDTGDYGQKLNDVAGEVATKEALGSDYRTLKLTESKGVVITDTDPQRTVNTTMALRVREALKK